MALLERFKGDKIAVAREYADYLIGVCGYTTVSSVYDELLLDGLISEGEKLHWLGAIFRQPKYQWTGRWADGTKTAAKHSAQPAKVWAFA